MSAQSKKLRGRLLKLIAAPSYQPMNKSELARALDVTPKERAALRALLGELERDGELRLVKKGRYAPRQRRSEMVGILRFQAKGHAFADPVEDGGRGKGVFVPASATGNALHGDKVLVALQRDGGAPGWTRNIKSAAVRGRLEAKYGGREELAGRVVKVLERNAAPAVGTFRRGGKGKFTYVQPDDPNLPPTIELEGDLPGPPPAPGDKVVVEILRWESRRESPRGRITKVLGPPDAPGVDILGVIHARRLPLEFPPAVLREAESFPDHVREGDLDGREDWRGRPVFTIDPDDARDFDDAILVTELDGGGWELAVHIADVSHYVKPGSALDKEALARGNSTYLADRVIPMLPPVLSNGLCSLVPGEDRLTHAAVLRFDREGAPAGVRFCRAVIHSERRFTYKEAIALLREPDPGDPFSKRLEIAWALASKLRERRFAGGALDLDMPEVRAVLDGSGRPTALERIEYDESHQLIEEFMLAANEAVAKVTKDKLKPSLYRTHEDPDADKLFEYRQLALSYGLSVGDLSNRAEIQSLLAQVRGKPCEHAIKVGLLKSLKRATYEHHPEGHYGLAKVNYTHFTSPIRRYADLVVHRVLGAITGSAPGKTPPLAELEATAEHLSETERTSADAEFETQKLKQLEYLWIESRAAAKGEPATHPALVHEVRRKGLFVELTDYFIKGLVAEAALPPCGGGYWFDGTYGRFVGERPKRVFQAGDTVEVAVAKVDFERRLVDFKVVDDGEHRADPDREAPPKRERGPKKPPAAKRARSSSRSSSKRRPAKAPQRARRTRRGGR